MYSHTLSFQLSFVMFFIHDEFFFLKNKHFFLLFFYSTVLILTTWMSVFVALLSFGLSPHAPLGISLGSEFYVSNKQYIGFTFLKLKISQLEGSKHRVFL